MWAELTPYRFREVLGEEIPHGFRLLSHAPNTGGPQP
jgi:hypothetical protein